MMIRMLTLVREPTISDKLFEQYPVCPYCGAANESQNYIYPKFICGTWIGDGISYPPRQQSNACRANQMTKAFKTY